jgi:hypothetical protein
VRYNPEIHHNHNGGAGKKKRSGAARLPLVWWHIYPQVAFTMAKALMFRFIRMIPSMIISGIS